MIDRHLEGRGTRRQLREDEHRLHRPATAKPVQVVFTRDGVSLPTAGPPSAAAYRAPRRREPFGVRQLMVTSGGTGRRDAGRSASFDMNRRGKSCLIPLAAIVVITSAAEASAQAMVREQKVISSAGARAMVDACTAWAERNHVTLAMSVLDLAGNLIESHGGSRCKCHRYGSAEGEIGAPLAPTNLRNEQDRALRPKSGADFHARFSATWRLADRSRRRSDRLNGRFQCGRGKMRPSRDRRSVQQTKSPRAVSR
jgi:hypothetical protein